eukprot:4886501-Pyramimonas_sp.AAC.1
METSTPPTSVSGGAIPASFDAGGWLSSGAPKRTDDSTTSQDTRPLATPQNSAKNCAAEKSYKSAPPTFKEETLSSEKHRS